MSREVSGAPVQPEGAVYKPPPKHACECSTWFVPVTPENRISCHIRVYKTRIVHFAIEHQTRLDGEWHAVARIDSSDSIHLHVFDRYGTSVVDHQLITAIPPSPQGQSVVHNGWEDAFDYIDDHWAEHLRRWSE